MARPSDVMLGNTAYGRGATQPMTDLGYGGQHGWAPNYKELIANQAYIRRNLICVLLEAPGFFQVMPEPELWVETLKSLVELHAIRIEGLNAGLTVEFDEHPVGGGGEMQQEVTDVKRARSEPSFTWIEKYGMPIQTFLYNWIVYGMMDPDTKYALTGTLDANSRPDDMLADWYTMTCLFIEPDPQHNRVMKSWIVTNMMPKGTGEIVGKRDLQSASEKLELTIEFTGVAQFNLGSNLFAQTILDDIDIVGANPYLRQSFVTDVNSTVKASEIGYNNSAVTVGTDQINPDESSAAAAGNTGVASPNVQKTA